MLYQKRDAHQDHLSCICHCLSYTNPPFRLLITEHRVTISNTNYPPNHHQYIIFFPWLHTQTHTNIYFKFLTMQVSTFFQIFIINLTNMQFALHTVYLLHCIFLSGNMICFVFLFCLICVGKRCEASSNYKWQLLWCAEEGSLVYICLDLGLNAGLLQCENC